MKPCPNCAAMIGNDDTRCRHCGSEITRLRAVMAGVKSALNGVGCGTTLLAFIGIMVLAQMWAAPPPPAPPTPDPSEEMGRAPSRLAAKDVEKCKAAHNEARAGQIIKYRSSPNEFYMDESTWAVLPAPSKKEIMAVMACAVFSRAPDELQPGERIEIYGLHNDKIIGKLGVMGYEIN